MFSAPRSKAEGEVDHSGTEWLFHLAHLPSERWTWSGADNHLLAEEWNAVVIGENQHGGNIEEREKVEGVGNVTRL